MNNQLRNKREVITTYPSDLKSPIFLLSLKTFIVMIICILKRTLKGYYEQVYTNKF